MSGNTFNCPYCWSEIPLQASVCSHCTRDLVLFKPLALQLQAMAEEVTQLKATVQQHAATLAQLSTQDIRTAALAYAQDQDGEPPTTSLSPTETSWAALCISALLTTIAIGLCHWVLLFIYDAPPLMLRLLTITLPALTGFLGARHSRLGWFWHAIAALLVSTSAVCLMLAITAHIDSVALWPDNPRDWREAFEYAASIGLSFFTGFLIYSLIQRWSVEQRKKISLKILLSRDENGKYKIAEVTHQVQSLVATVAPIVSAGTALYSGLKIFIGN